MGANLCVMPYQHISQMLPHFLFIASLRSLLARQKRNMGHILLLFLVDILLLFIAETALCFISGGPTEFYSCV